MHVGGESLQCICPATVAQAFTSSPHIFPNLLCLETDLYRHERALIADQDQDVYLRRSDLLFSFSQMNLTALANVAV